VAPETTHPRSRKKQLSGSDGEKMEKLISLVALSYLGRPTT
jgi:hypothetical protein